MAKITKKDIYSQYGIQYDGKNIKAPLFGNISPLLVNGNEKHGGISMKLEVYRKHPIPGGFCVNEKPDHVYSADSIACDGRGFWLVRDGKQAGRVPVLGQSYLYKIVTD